jgi:hypothetical protein
VARTRRSTLVLTGPVPRSGSDPGGAAVPRAKRTVDLIACAQYETCPAALSARRLSDLGTPRVTSTGPRRHCVLAELSRHCPARHGRFSAPRALAAASGRCSPCPRARQPCHRLRHVNGPCVPPLVEHPAHHSHRARHVHMQCQPYDDPSASTLGRGLPASPQARPDPRHGDRPRGRARPPRRSGDG